MHSVLYRVGQSCVEQKIIKEEELDWLVYGLEKRITTAVTALFFLSIGIQFTNTLSVTAFLLSFYFLRVRTNGYHANSFIGCMLFSLFLEILFLWFILPTLNLFAFISLNTSSLLVIYLFAPFPNLSMHLDEKELVVCRKTSRIRISLLSAASILLYTLGELSVSKGITLGNTMTALLLLIAYIKREGENKHEKRKQHR